MTYTDSNNTFWEAVNLGSLPSTNILLRGGQVANQDPLIITALQSTQPLLLLLKFPGLSENKKNLSKK